MGGRGVVVEGVVVVIGDVGVVVVVGVGVGVAVVVCGCS